MTQGIQSNLDNAAVIKDVNAEKPCDCVIFRKNQEDVALLSMMEPTDVIMKLKKQFNVQCFQQSGLLRIILQLLFRLYFIEYVC